MKVAFSGIQESETFTSIFHVVSELQLLVKN